MINIREEAIELLLCFYTSPDNDPSVDERIVELALAAHKAAGLLIHTYPDVYLEAAGLLLDGWMPGDGVTPL